MATQSRPHRASRPGHRGTSGTRKRILAQKDLKQLERWLEKAIVATSIDDLFKSRS